MSKKILVTGAKGFLGRFVVDQIKDQIPLATTLSKRSPFDKGDKALIDTDSVDLTRLEEVEKLKKSEFEEIVHIAGVTSKNKDKYPEGFEANVNMMENMIKLAKVKNINRVIFISSNSVNYRTDEYANSKRHAEELLIKSGLEYVILRPTLILGSASASTDKMKKWLNIMPFIPLPNRGETSFSPINPTDLAKLIVKVVESKNKGIYTVGGERISYREYMEKVAGKKLNIVNINSGLFLMISKLCGLTTARGMVSEIKTDNDKLKDIYGFLPSQE
ncbi:NAD(P)-dependent oxidoreductase [Candidatus Shapirobacteria bacterium]|nr:NAD(P)-dependent oxidoreductase [Candidatus Shapirobacteria bacterium]